MKKALAIILSVLILLPVIFYFTIHFTNNHIASLTLNKLEECPLPAGAALEDTLSAAGKFTGNGNGMQYMGAILISGELDIKQVEEHYKNKLEHFEIREQSAPVLEFESSKDYSFGEFKNPNLKYFSVINWGSAKDYFSKDISNILIDFDIRGH